MVLLLRRGQRWVGPFRQGQGSQVVRNIPGIDGQRLSEIISDELESLPNSFSDCEARKIGSLSRLLDQAQQLFCIGAALEERLCQALYFTELTFAVITLGKG